ncbi:class I SAM-dependent methyltransferase [Caulobacter sp. S45]|uniref:class I SAM-dependent methyltransferase n=1 Tax=Caulobacter sp. S45 TaxID=1641861 RepID=UPI0015757056|nr:class I SAM-dependent methyltransferase [Caulobacter sp. S45]
MDIAEFDRFADEYTATHAGNIRLSGETPDYFARYKIEEMRRRWDAQARPEPSAVLDFGTGIGNSLPYLAKLFPGAAITGVDVSQRSLQVAAHRFPGVAHLLAYDGSAIPLEGGSFDLIFSACVFHHIDQAEHGAIFAELHRLLSPGGMMVVFEHNPVNPATRYIVATCPFDENAVLLPAAALKKSQAEAGFREVEVAYTGFFPGPLRALRPLERFMTALPVGAQYYTVARG